MEPMENPPKKFTRMKVGQLLEYCRRNGIETFADDTDVSLIHRIEENVKKRGYKKSRAGRILLFIFFAFIALTIYVNVKTDSEQRQPANHIAELGNCFKVDRNNYGVKAHSIYLKFANLNERPDTLKVQQISLDNGQKKYKDIVLQKLSDGSSHLLYEDFAKEKMQIRWYADVIEIIYKDYVYVPAWAISC